MKQIAVRLTALLLALVMTTTLALAANKSGYSDVPDKHWAAESIAQCKQYNLLQGIGNGKFGLGQKMTRAAYAAALCRLMGWKTVTPEKGSFTDNQDTKKWYFSAIETASEHDVFPGHSTTCRPNDAITREEMAAMTVRALGYSTLSGTVQDECPFTDVTTNPGYITLAWRMGLVTGMNAATFAPKSDTTREQAAAVLLRAYQGLKAKVSVTAVSAAPAGAVLAESLTGTSGTVPLSPRAAVEQVYDAAVKAGRGGSVTINAVPAAQTVKGGKAGELRTLSQEELSAYLSSSDVQKARSGRFDSSYLSYRKDRALRAPRHQDRVRAEIREQERGIPRKEGSLFFGFVRTAYPTGQCGAVRRRLPDCRWQADRSGRWKDSDMASGKRPHRRRARSRSACRAGRRAANWGGSG